LFASAISSKRLGAAGLPIAHDLPVIAETHQTKAIDRDLGRIWAGNWRRIPAVESLGR
jgi:hypothetical protein